MGSWFQDLQRRGLGYRAAVLGLPVLVLYLLVAPIALYVSGAMGLIAGAIGAFVCLLGAIIALVIQDVVGRVADPVSSVLVGMAARMGLPLAVALVLHISRGPLAQAGVLYYFLVFYPVTLTVETALSLPPPQKPVRRSPKTVEHESPTHD